MYTGKSDMFVGSGKCQRSVSIITPLKCIFVTCVVALFACDRVC